MKKQDKLSIIKSVLAGTMTFEHLKPPRVYIVFATNDIYEVDGVEMNEETYIEWRKTVREIDNILIFRGDTTNEPITEDIEPEVVCIQQQTENPTQIHIPVEVIENKVYDEIPPPPPEPVELFAIPVKRGGKLSDYGEGWRLSDYN